MTNNDADSKGKSRKGKKEKYLFKANEEKYNDNSKCTKKRSFLDDKSFADTRLSQNCLAWPCTIDGERLLTLGCGFLHSCKGYDCYGERNNNDDNVYGSNVCQSCDKLASTHELSISPSTAKISPHPLSIISIASVIVATRNLRCVIGEYHPKDGVVSNNEMQQIQPPLNSIICSPNMIPGALDSYTGRILALIKKMQEHQESNKPSDFITNHNERLYSLNAISDADLEMLQEKTSGIIEAMLNYKRAIAGSTVIDLVEKRLVAMASCDALYFRCYYAAITSCIATDKTCDLIVAIIPHPATYFSCPGFTWDTQNTGLEALRAFLDELNDDTTKHTLLKSWELEDWLPSGLVGTHKNILTNPLLSLWQSRFLESIRHLWLNRYSKVKLPITLSQTSKQNKHGSNANANVSMPANSTRQEVQLTIHETKTLSSALMRWRDSIRDYPANFYAYAVPTNEALHAISKCFIHSDVNQIVEAGAGTGYWSAIILKHLKALKKIRSDGLEKGAYDPTVLAYDIAPSSSGSANEYHGKIPSFTHIHQADDFRDFLSSSTASGVKSAQAALLLCYPPPGSEMACKVLSAYLGSGGRVVIHVGEWQGLTGTVTFESRLSAMCFCQDVVHLPCWGSDATYLTIWRRKYDGVNFHYNCTSTFTAAHASAYGYCSLEQCKNLSRRRCRFARCLQYCNSECYKSHSSYRKSTLALHMIDTMSEDQLKFDDADHFLDMSSIISTEQEVSNDCYAKPRRKKKQKKRH